MKKRNFPWVERGTVRPSLGWQFGFLRGFCRGETASAPPYALTVDVTLRCNLNCLHCRRHSPLSVAAQAAFEYDFPLELFLSLCLEAKELGIRKVVLIGDGEPLMHPSIMEMVAAAKQAGCAVTLLTNGTLLSANHAREFQVAGLDELRVSLWASDVEEYKDLYPGSPPSLFRRAVEGVKDFTTGIRAAGGHRPRVVLHRPIDRRFFRRREGTLDLARETGCDAVSFSPVKPLLQDSTGKLLSGGEVRELLGLLPTLGRKVTALGLEHNLGDLRRRLELGREVWRKLPCYIGWVDMRVRINGDVLPCDTCNWVLGNVRQNGLREIWNGRPYCEFRRATRRPESLAESGRCNCDYCCHAVANQRLHRLLCWVPSPVPAAREVSA